jgi:hypothetical protein
MASLPYDAFGYYKIINENFAGCMISDKTYFLNQHTMYDDWLVFLNHFQVVSLT